MTKTKVKKKGVNIAKTISSLKDLDKNIASAMKSMDASINITLSPSTHSTKKKKKVKKK
jgi:hypothetical protein